MGRLSPHLLLPMLHIPALIMKREVNLFAFVVLGGIGAMNHALWLKEQLPSSTTLSLLLDSSWFINFNQVIEREFGFDESMISSATTTARSDPTTTTTTTTTTTASPDSNTTQTQEDNLFSIIAWHPPCRQLHINAPCCISARCLLSNSAHFPRETAVFAIVSLYDVFLLGASLRGLAVLASEESEEESLKPGYALDFLRTVSEYGGVMNRSIAELTDEVEFVSVYVTGCFQHIYLATSTLWGETGQSLFGESPVELNHNDVGIRYCNAKWHKTINRISR